MSTKMYWSLLVREKGVWGVQFGDEDKSVVSQEKKDSWSRHQSSIVGTSGEEADIQAVVNLMNMMEKE